NLSVDQKSYTFKGLQPGTEYIFNITAVNSVGPGPEASCRVVTKERAPSGPVQDLTVIAEGASALRLTWQPPELLKRNGRMTNYSVTVWPVSATAGANDCELAGSDAKVQFRCSGTAAFIGPRSDSRPGGGAAGSLGPAICFSEHNPLKAFTEYQVRLTPLNAVGAGPPNCVRVRTLESTPRSPPASPRCEAKSNSQILVSWRAPDPSSVNGIAKDYQIQYMPAQDAIEQNETLAKEETSEGSEHLVSGLQMYTNYSFTVTVANSKGRSAPTSRIFCRTQSAPPDPPLDVRAYGVNATHAVLAWRQTEAPNGRLKGYKIKYTCSDKTASEIDHPLPAGGPVSHYEHQLIGGLSVNAQCEFSVAAENDNFLGRYSRRELLFVSETPRLQVVSFRQDFLVTQSARLVLDCYIVGHGNTSPRWTMPTVDSPRTERLPNGSLVITGLRNIGGPHRYKCSDTDDTSSVTYNVQVATVQNLPVPQTPRLLPGQRTNSSLEVIWRPMGIGSRDSASIPVAAGDSLIAGYNLNYVNLYSAAEDTRTVSARNRSYLVDPVQCGAAMKFRIRAVNGFDLKSPYTEYMEMRTLGSRPVLRSGAGPIAQILTNRIGIEFNFTDILPGDGCHAYKYLVYLNSLPLENGFERGILQPTAVATRDSLENGCCLKVLDSNLLTGLARRGVSAEGRLLHFAVVAHNAAGNLTIQSSLKLTGLLLRGIDGRGEVGHAGTSGAKESSRSQPNLPNGMPSSGGISGWQNWPYILAAGVLALLLVCLFALINCSSSPRTTCFRLISSTCCSNSNSSTDDEDDRESVDSKGNIRAYATFDATTVHKAGPQRPWSGGGAAAAQSSQSRFCNKAEELVDAPIPDAAAAAATAAHTAEYEENSGSSETTDARDAHTAEYEENSGSSRDPRTPTSSRAMPNLHQPAAQPQRAASNATCEVLSVYDPRSRQPQPPMLGRHRRQPSMAESEQTYESIDDPGPRHRLAGGGAGGSSIYNSYRPSQRLYWPERQQQPAAAMPATREDVEDEVQQLLGGNRLPADAPAGPQQQRAADADDGRDSADSTEDDPTYDTRNVTFV
uniref:Protein-tyrosine-phosphatase n=1 Tax=Macrostomum lignano TaxID=282301 RepID=A0A1I8I9S1_9PLAT